MATPNHSMFTQPISSKTTMPTGKGLCTCGSPFTLCIIKPLKRTIETFVLGLVNVILLKTIIGKLSASLDYHLWYPHLSPQALIEALHIVMKNNRMRFGNMFIHQHKGIAMGMAPAPSIANLFVAIYEEAHITTFPSTSLHFLRRFIDDGFGVWLRDPNPQQDELNWENFQSIVNGMGLKWEFSSRSFDVTFIDLNIHLREGRLHTSLYAKPMALHLYIPPTSCHAPGIATGLVFGHFYRIFQLCSHQNDIKQEM